MVDSEVLVTGSLNGFLLGKHYNRCKRLHPLLSLAFQLLHFEKYIEAIGPIPDDLLEHLRLVTETATPHSYEALEQQESYCEFRRGYDTFVEETKQGALGSTAAFWMKYVGFVEDWLLFNRACRTNDVDLFIDCLHQMVPLLFACNKSNYSHWMTMYVMHLLNIDRSHPGLHEILGKGALSVRRSQNQFSRNPVDMTLEQTINQDAASRMTGISAFQQSIAAKNRWTMTRSARSTVVSALMEKAGLKKVEDVNKDLRPSRIKKDHGDVQCLVTAIKGTCDPFKEQQREDLYSISTGKAVSTDVRNDLLSLVDKGKMQYTSFKTECINDAARFEKPIKRNKSKNFASGAVTKLFTSKEKKVMEVKGTRDLFGRLLYMAYEMKIDLQAGFQYPLTPVPLCLGDISGAKHSTSKSTLARYLEKKVTSDPPNSIDVYIVDAMYFIRSSLSKHLHATYGALAYHILSQICIAKRVDFVCDTYPTPCIKDEEQGKRGIQNLNIVITGPKQKRPKDFKSALESRTFKKDFLQFLAEEWSKDEYKDLLKECTVYVNYNNICIQLTGNENGVETTAVPELRNTHDEADTILALHANHASSTQPDANIVVRANDTDVLVILIYHSNHFKCQLFMDVGSNDDNTRRYIHVTKLAESMENMSLVLPALHAFTGCDYTASFLRRGKIKLYERVETSEELQELFCSYGSGDSQVEHLNQATEKLVCAMYGKPKMEKLSDVRYSLFKQKYSPSKFEKEHNLLAKLKGAESSWLLPPLAALLQKVKCTNYVSAYWKAAHTQDPLSSFGADPLECGWKLEEGQYKIVWFEGEQLPPSIAQNIIALSTEVEEEAEEANISRYDSDSDSDSDNDE